MVVIHCLFFSTVYFFEVYLTSACWACHVSVTPVCQTLEMEHMLTFLNNTKIHATFSILVINPESGSSIRLLVNHINELILYIMYPII